MNKRLKVLSGIAFCALVGIFGLFLSGDTYASTESISRKWSLSLYRQCIANGAENEELTVDEQKSKSNVLDSIIVNNLETSLTPSYGFGGFGETTTCEEVLENSMSYNYSNKIDTNWKESPVEASKLVTEVFQYDLVGEENEFFQICGTVSMSGPYGTEEPYGVCSAKIWYNPEVNRYIVYDGGDAENWIKVSNPGSGSGSRLDQSKIRISLTLVGQTFGPYETDRTLKSEISSKFKSRVYKKEENGQVFQIQFGDKNNDIIKEGKDGVYKLSDRSRYDTITKLNGDSELENITHDELAELYTYYIENSLPNGQKERITCGDESVTTTKYIKHVKLLRGGTVQLCTVDYGAMYGEGDIDPSATEVTMINESSTITSGSYFKTGKITDIITWLNNNLTVGATVSGGDENTNPQDTEDPCYGGSGSLGWILCPIVSKLISAANTIYDDVESNYLQLNPNQLFKNNSVQQAWNIFRDIANITIVIVLLVIIFSQITGIKIDNYGLKKVLPKLILTAILINLSFIICELVVDVSNILGANLKNMFEGFATSVSTGNATSASGAQYVIVYGGIITIALAAVIINPALLLTAVLFLLTAVLSILFLWILLIMREVGIILLITLAPCAFACNILPNMEKYFKKWVDAMKRLLLLYPICGALVGAGLFAANILQGSVGEGTSIGISLAVMIIPVLPFFLIPTLLKGSFKALGNIGTTVSGFGKSFSKNATRKISSSEGYKNLQRIGGERRNRIKAGIDKNGNFNAIGRAKTRIAGTRIGTALGYNRMLASQKAIDDKVRSANEDADASLINARSASEMIKNDETPKEYYDRLLSNAKNESDIRSITKAAINSGMLPKDVAELVRKNLTQMTSKMDKGRRQKFMRDFAVEHGNGFLSTDYEMLKHMQNGGLIKGTTMEFDLSGSKMGDYAKTGSIETSDIKKSDIQKMSGRSLASMIANGTIDKGLASQALQEGGLSNDKMIMLGMQKDGMASGINAEALKVYAESVANGAAPSINSVTLSDGKSVRISTGVTSGMVDNWTHPQAAGVRIEDVEIHNRQGRTTQTDPLWVTTESPKEGGSIIIKHDDREKAIARNYSKEHDLSNISTEQLQKISANPKATEKLRLGAERELKTRNNRPKT